MIKKLIDLLTMLEIDPSVLVQVHGNNWYGLYLEPLEIVQCTPIKIDKDQFFSKLLTSRVVGVICARTGQVIPGFFKWDFTGDQQQLTWYYSEF